MTDAKSNGRWKPGQSGNPGGRKTGQRHRATVMLERLMADDAKAIVKAVILAASTGDMVAARMVLDRVVPPAKDRPLKIDLPDTSTPTGIVAAQAAIVAAVAGGDLLPSEGAALAALVDGQRRALELDALDRRISELEARG